MAAISPEEIQKLSVAERLALIEALWDTISAEPDALPLTDAQKREIDRRLERYAQNASRLVDKDSDAVRQAAAMLPRNSDLDEEQLVEKHIGLTVEKYGGRAEARLKSGPSIWAIVSYLDIYEGDRDEIADHFGISQEEIDAALAFYHRNKKYIDARILLNEA